MERCVVFLDSVQAMIRDPDHTVFLGGVADVLVCLHCAVRLYTAVRNHACPEHISRDHARNNQTRPVSGMRLS